MTIFLLALPSNFRYVNYIKQNIYIYIMGRNNLSASAVFITYLRVPRHQIVTRR